MIASICVAVLAMVSTDQSKYLRSKRSNSNGSTNTCLLVAGDWVVGRMNCKDFAQNLVLCNKNECCQS